MTSAPTTGLPYLRRAVCLAVALALLAPPAFAAPSTQPATQPAASASTRPANLPAEDPVAAYAKYTLAAKAGNTAGMLEYVYARTDIEKRVANALVETDRALADLALATREAFGEEGMIRQQAAMGDARPDGLTATLAANEKLAYANLLDPAGNPVTAMILDAGKWKIYVRPTIEFWQGDAKLIAALNQARDHAQRYLRELKAGKYKTIEDLEAAIKAG